MNDFIFNVLPTQGPTIPMWVPLLGGFPINSPLVGSFLGVSLAFVINWAWQTWNSKRLTFEEEYYIKAELSGIGHDLRVGGRPEQIKPIYGADHVRKYRLFGEYRTQVIYWYEAFQKYNFELEKFNEELDEIQKHSEESEEQHLHEEIYRVASKIETNRESMANQIEYGFLRSDWLKRIPNDLSNSGLSKTKLIWYLLNQDALEEPTTNRDFWIAAVDKIGRVNDELANLDYLLAGGRIN
jgi:hypothetical protein